MMENRSFDHVLGWLPGVNGRQGGLSYLDKDGVAHETWPLGPDFQGCAYEDPDHTWAGIAVQYADGRCDGFLQTAKVGDRFPIGYYREDELPILSALAKGYTTFDNYFCSMMGPTWENRLYQITGTTQLDEGWCDKEGERRPVLIPTAIFDRVRDAGLTAGYYYHESPVTGLFASRRYDGISYPIEQFWRDAREGKLANVVFVDPNYTDRAEDMGTSNDYHPGATCWWLRASWQRCTMRSRTVHNGIGCSCSISTNTAAFSITCRRRLSGRHQARRPRVRIRT